MTDFASLGISIDSRPVLEGAKALDALADSASRVEPKVTSATKAVDGMGEASINVWRRGGEATKSIDALGEATARTGQKIVASNSQMNDTAKLTKMWEEQSRATAQANIALGNTTTQMTLGQQLFIDKLRDQVAVLGMSRSQLLAYQAAELGVTQETEKLIAKMKQFEDANKAAAEAAKAAAAAKNQQATAGLGLSDVLDLLAKGYAALKVAEYVKDAALMAARYETLGIVMEVVGRNAGYTKTQMMTATEAIAKQGITMIESRESAVKLVQAHVDLKNATVLARIAQDAAVIGHLNSSDAFDRLVNGISRGNVLILRNIGINVNLQTAYRQMAEELGKTTKELTENERVQARLNAVIDRGSDIAGTYEAAMGTAGKQITSMQRYMTDLKTVAGETFLEVLTVTVMGLTAGLKDANGEVSEMSRNNQLHEWGSALAQVFVTVADNVNNAVGAVKILAAAAGYASTAMDIANQYKSDVISAGFSPSAQVAAYQKQTAAMAENVKLFTDTKNEILAGEDKFQKAYDERVATQIVKRKAEAADKLKVDTDYAKAATAILVKSATEGVAAQEAARQKVIKLYNDTYVGTPTYRDTEGRPAKEVKPKADQAENTRLASDLKRIAETVAAEKAATEYLMKLDEMRHKAGEIGDAAFYESRREHAAELAGFEIEGYNKQLVELRKHHNMTAAETEKNAKAILDVIGKKKAAGDKFAYDELIRDEEARIRLDAGAKAADAAALKEIASINAQVAAVEMQIRTYNMLPAAKTAILIADLQVEKSARVAFDNDAKAIALIDAKIDGLNRLKTVQAVATAQDTGNDVAKAKELLDILTAVDTATKSAASGMAESFGAVGKAIGGLTTALSGYAVQQQAITAKLAADKADPKNAGKFAELEATASKASAQAQIKNYGDIAGATKGFFKENSAGYRAMEGAEKAYRAFEMAMAIESMAKKLFTVTAVTTATVGGEAAKVAAVEAGTAAQLASDTVKGVSAASVAVATQAQGDPYSAWIRMAAMAAAMAALGFAVSGGGGGSTTAKDRQAANGVGTVLGDSNTDAKFGPLGSKSESIANSLKLVEDNTYRDMEISGAMLASLRNIETSLGGLGNLVARVGALDGKSVNAAAGVGYSQLGGTLGTVTGAAAGGVGGAMAGTYLGMGPGMLGALGGPIGLAIGAVLGTVLGGLASKLFGSTKTVTDYGITSQSATLGSIQADGFQGQTYADVETKKKAFGISYSTKTKTDLQDLDVGIERQFGLVIDSLADGVAQAVSILGIGGADFAARMQTFKVELGDISFKDLKGDERQAALEAAFGAVGDKMALFAINEVENFAQVGEGAFETLTRLANDYATVDAVLASFGDSFGAVGFASVEARERLIALSGGLEKFATQGSFFLENFFTDKEKASTLRTSVNSVLTPINGGVDVKTYDQFKQLALAQDRTTQTGAQAYATIMGVAQAFQKLTEYGDENGKAILSSQQIIDQATTLQEKYNSLTMTSAQLRAIERNTIDDANLALYDSVQAAQTAAAGRELDIQIMELSGNKVGALAARRADELAGIEDTLKPQQLRIYALQDEATATAEANTILGLQAQMYQAMGDKAGEAAVLELQHTAALVGMTPAVADASIKLWDAQKAEKARNTELATANSILGYQQQIAESTNNKVAAATASQELFNLTLKNMTPEVAGWAVKAREAQLTQKAANDKLEDSNKLLGFESAMYTAKKDKINLALTAEKQFQNSIVGLTPALADAATAAHKAELAAKAHADGLAESNNILSAQAGYYEATGETAKAAAVKLAQQKNALADMSPELAGWTQKMWDAEKAAAITKANRSLEIEILELTGRKIEALTEKRKDEAKGADASTKALLDQRNAAQDVEAAAKVNEARERIEVQMLELQGKKTEALTVSRRSEFWQLDSTLVPMMQRLHVLQDEATAATEAAAILDLLGQRYEAQGNAAGLAGVKLQQQNAALAQMTPALAAATKATWDAQAAQKVAETRRGIEIEIMNAQGKTAEALAATREDEIKALEMTAPALVGLKKSLYGLQDAAALAEKQHALDITLLEATGKSAAALAVKRWDELAALTGTARATQLLIYAAEDAATALTAAKTATDAALAAAQKAVEVEKTRITVIRDAAAESVTSIKGVFDLLKTQVEQLYGTVGSTAAMQAAQGAAFIDDALLAAQTGGKLPDQQDLADAIAAARGGLDATQYATQFEADRAALVMAGKLAQIQSTSGYQLSAAEQALAVANDQLTALDAQLTLAQQQVDTLNGINASVTGLPESLAALAAAIAAQKAATAPAPQTYASAPTALTSMPTQTGGSYATTRMGEADLVRLSGGVSFLANDTWSQEQTASYVSGLMSTYSANAQALASLTAYGKDEHLPGFAVGINYVPQDMTARIHEGEAIVPASFNPFNPSARQFGNSGNEELIAEIRELRVEVGRLRGDVGTGNNSLRRIDSATNGNPDQPVPVAILEDETA